MPTRRQTLDLARVRGMTPKDRREARQGAGLSQGDVARALDCTPGAVRLWETGQRVPSGTLGERYGRLLLDLSKVQR